MGNLYTFPSILLLQKIKSIKKKYAGKIKQDISGSAVFQNGNKHSCSNYANQLKASMFCLEQD